MRRVEKKSRDTQQLQAIWDAIKDDKSHPTADQVYDKARRRLPNVSLGTVYRNLQKLVADEKLQVLMPGRVLDVLVNTEGEITPAKLPHAGFQVSSHQVAF
jgi:hypothetical protein